MDFKKILPFPAKTPAKAALPARAVSAVLAVLMGAALLLSGCGNKEETVLRPEDYDAFLSAGLTSEMNTPDYWIAKAKKLDKVLLTRQKIQQLNQQILTQEGLGCYDILNAPAELKKAELSALLLRNALPDTPRYIEETAVDESYYTNLMSNVNLAGLEETNLVSYGVVADNAPMRAFPTNDPSYARPNDLERDLFQLTTLKTWEQVRVLHQSLDGLWYYVQSYSDMGWVPVESVALVSTKEEWRRYGEGAVLVVTGNRIQLGANPYTEAFSQKELRMGARLPLVAAADAPKTIDGMAAQGSYIVMLPIRGANGMLTTRLALIPRSADVNFGYLEYTQANLLRQAFKLVGDRYSQGGLFDGRDDGMLIQDVYAAFGIFLPREGSRQAQVTGNPVSLAQPAALSELEEEDKRKILSQLKAGAILYMDGHAMLYLGQSEEVPYILHAVSQFGVSQSADSPPDSYDVNTVAVTDLGIYHNNGQTYLTNLSACVSIGG